MWGVPGVQARIPSGGDGLRAAPVAAAPSGPAGFRAAIALLAAATSDPEPLEAAVDPGARREVGVGQAHAGLVAQAHARATEAEREPPAATPVHTEQVVEPQILVGLGQIQPHVGAGLQIGGHLEDDPDRAARHGHGNGAGIAVGCGVDEQGVTHRGTGEHGDGVRVEVHQRGGGDAYVGHLPKGGAGHGEEDQGEQVSHGAHPTPLARLRRPGCVPGSGLRVEQGG